MSIVKRKLRLEESTSKKTQNRVNLQIQAFNEEIRKYKERVSHFVDPSDLEMCVDMYRLGTEKGVGDGKNRSKTEIRVTMENGTDAWFDREDKVGATTEICTYDKQHDGPLEELPEDVSNIAGFGVAALLIVIRRTLIEKLQQYIDHHAEKFEGRDIVGLLENNQLLQLGPKTSRPSSPERVEMPPKVETKKQRKKREKAEAKARRQAKKEAKKAAKQEKALRKLGEKTKKSLEKGVKGKEFLVSSPPSVPRQSLTSLPEKHVSFSPPNDIFNKALVSERRWQAFQTKGHKNNIPLRSKVAGLTRTLSEDSLDMKDTRAPGRVYLSQSHQQPSFSSATPNSIFGRSSLQPFPTPPNDISPPPRNNDFKSGRRNFNTGSRIPYAEFDNPLARERVIKKACPFRDGPFTNNEGRPSYLPFEEVEGPSKRPLTLNSNLPYDHYGLGDHSPSKRTKGADVFNINPIAQQIKAERERVAEEKRQAYVQQLENERANQQLLHMQQQIEIERQRLMDFSHRTRERYEPRGNTYYQNQRRYEATTNPLSYESLSEKLLAAPPENTFSRARAESAPVGGRRDSDAVRHALRGDVVALNHPHNVDREVQANAGAHVAGNWFADKLRSKTYY